MRHFNLIVLSSLVLAFVGCTPDKKSGSSDGTTFIVKSVEGWAERGPVSQVSQWKVPTSISLGIRACLKDNSSRDEVRKQRFFVNAPGGREVTTDEFGCLRWEESLPYNFFAGRSGWITVQREILGRGAASGRRVIELAINPWAVGDHARDAGQLSIVYLKEGKDGFIPRPLYKPEQSHTFLMGDDPGQGRSRMIIKSIKIRALPEKETSKSVVSRYMLTMEPRIYSLKANGEDTYEMIRDGEFDVKVQLLSSNVGPQMNQKVAILDPAVVPVGKGRVTDGTLHAEVYISQTLRANQGNLELAIRITPRAIGGNATIKPFNGLFALGLGTLAEDGSADRFSECDENSSACDFDQVMASTQNVDQLREAGYVRDMERYEIEKIKLRFLMVQPGETATQRTVAYTASTCIKDVYGKPLAHTPMTIRYKPQDKTKVKIRPDDDDLPDNDDDEDDPSVEDDQHTEIERQVISKSTDESGCLNWDGLIFHKYYKPEQYFERNIEIEKASGFKQSFTFYVNPWDTNINFGFDSREFTPEQIKQMRHGKRVRSRFFLGNFGYHTVRFLYNIDPFMELEVRKTVLMEIVPQVLRYSGIKDARKMVEHLRDGIYLMKVAIQKSYLDPRDNSRWLLTNSTSLQPKKENIGNESLSTKEFITTNMALVRVVDGMIIYPIELTMRDLRLMRVRSNFMVELQTVDERLIQAYHVFKGRAIDRQGLEGALKAYKDKLGQSVPVDATDLYPELKSLNDQRVARAEMYRDYASKNQDLVRLRNDLNSKTKETQSLVANYLQVLRKQLTDGGALGRYLNSSGQQTDIPIELTQNQNINDNFAMDEQLLRKLKKTLNRNDFSRVQLPSREEVDLELFIEQNAGLRKRSFVGPVIFLSNAYSDSVRATDNLDEVKCANKEHPKDIAQQSMDALKIDNFENCLRENAARTELCEDLKEDGTANAQQNNKYKENPFFGSLSHLCFKDVDDLMAQERETNAQIEDRYAAASLKYNFVNSYPFKMDFVSLTGEPLRKYDESCKGRVANCLVETNENTVSVSSLESDINLSLERAKGIVEWKLSSLTNWWRGRKVKISKTRWAPGEYQQLFYERNANTGVAMCNLLANRITRELRDQKLNESDESLVQSAVVDLCTDDGGLIHDLKYRVEKTGDYTFLGGLNLNINVGESFSVGTSVGYSAELTDVIGGFVNLVPFGKAAGAVKGAMGLGVKPLGIKAGLSGSEGTSVSESTYLVSQNAKFELDLKAYEKCAVLRLSDQAVRAASQWINSRQIYGAGYVPTRNIRMADFNRPEVLETFKRGLMVCEGETRKNNEVKRVEEMYFYFTQHFTEGDMLDQADLYNHPWLLGMRGMRDFTTFVRRIRAQDPVNLKEFATYLIGWQDEHKKAWALEHMSSVYADVLPSFPGFYTVLNPNEDLSAFLLQQSRIKDQPLPSTGTQTFNKRDTGPLGQDKPRPTPNP